MELCWYDKGGQAGGKDHEQSKELIKGASVTYGETVMTQMMLARLQGSPFVLLLGCGTLTILTIDHSCRTSHSPPPGLRSWHRIFRGELPDTHD